MCDSYVFIFIERGLGVLRFIKYIWNFFIVLLIFIWRKIEIFRIFFFFLSVYCYV